VLCSQVEISPKRVQKTTNHSEFSGILYYQSGRELEKLLAYLYPPGIQYFHRGYYEHFRSSLCDIGGRGEKIMKKKLKLVRKPRTRSLFNTGTRPHKSNKDYTRKIKYKETTSEDEE